MYTKWIAKCFVYASCSLLTRVNYLSEKDTVRLGLKALTFRIN